jgi:hypothetical protein
MPKDNISPCQLAPNLPVRNCRRNRWASCHQRLPNPTTTPGKQSGTAIRWTEPCPPPAKLKAINIKLYSNTNIGGGVECWTCPGEQVRGKEPNFHCWTVRVIARIVLSSKLSVMHRKAANAELKLRQADKPTA